MRVAIDVTPLLGARTGVAAGLAGVLGALAGVAPDIELAPYVLSGRADASHRRAVALPASALLRLWARVDRPTADRRLGAADVVHGTNFAVPPMRTRPTTVSVHDCWCARAPAHCPAAHRLFAPVVQRAVRRGAWVHVTTEFVAAEVAERYGAERVAVVPFGVPPVGAGDGADLPAPLRRVSFVSALVPLDHRKGADTLVAAFAVPAAADPDLRLAIAGPDGDARPAVEAALADLDPAVAARVHLLGRVPDGARRALLSCATVVVVPSRYEGFGFPLLEAMAVGVPVVSTTGGALGEVAGDAAELVPPDDPVALGTALARVLADGRRRAALVDAGHRRVAHFSWEATATGLAELWRAAGAAG